MKKDVKIIKVIMLISVIIIAGFLFYFITQPQTQFENGTDEFRVTCSNSDNMSHFVTMIITDESDNKIFNSTYVIEPHTYKELYRSNLSNREYFVKVIVDGNWTSSISHRPTSLSWVYLYLNIEGHNLFIKHIN